jgi:hypothetical protein
LYACVVCPGILHNAYKRVLNNGQYVNANSLIWELLMSSSRVINMHVAADTELEFVM